MLFGEVLLPGKARPVLESREGVRGLLELGLKSQGIQASELTSRMGIQASEPKSLGASAADRPRTVRPDYTHIAQNPTFCLGSVVLQAPSS